MIKDSTYIRKFTLQQKQQMEIVSQEQKLKTVPDILFFCMDKYLEIKNDAERLQRIIEMRRKKEEDLKAQIKELENKIESINEIINDIKL